MIVVGIVSFTFENAKQTQIGTLVVIQAFNLLNYPMKQLTLCIDWTPNINHIGFFVAKHQGFYEKLGLDVKIVDPSQDNYDLTPAKRVEKGLADIALCPTESIISYRTKEKPFPLIGIATIFQRDVSAIAVKADSGIFSPRDLDGKRYASYNARYEDGIVRRMILNDGGMGGLEIGYPEKFGIWDTLINGNYDATWIFLNWEGMEAEELGADLRCFKMSDYYIPYSYSPLIAVDANTIESKREEYVRFLEGTRLGIAFCHENPEAAISMLRPYVPERDSKIDLSKALKYSLPYFGAVEEWGMMDLFRVVVFTEWLKETGIDRSPVDVTEIITNDLIRPNS